ncbi:TetR family transcriptional regulator [Nocardia asteroides NBRC 15531]|uniref:TetR family transcriptional regulator n=1 Tax=Nocardia asteroides NBRC 15531 TaxID=1110697 RepID=U5E783_NOCAS|nr:TetR family transcriptional regulator [Nocardia asteroides]TLF66714.1 TetR family transcriptional regulator [Nocardia asteroides NBRC 15531]UGT46176.1 TetR/AcrR family transcriptional regulator [Nocardia asteroides]SFM99061.1 transcriptional regulator, TetR family [Nocardia asteroides]VEG35027.1 Rut operon repressor [Nocardia asteroides]GAD82248.1 putative TetR family transcriptional regulator [Nocardia asteroides NBRC 15531]
MTAGSLRERSKARRREAILAAAYQLFAEQGFDATSIADIAEVAEVSPRTVTLYFPTKLELAMTHFTEYVDQFAGVLHARPAGQGILDTVEQWLRRKQAERDSVDELYNRMLQANPQLEGLCRGRLTDVIQDGARLLAEEQGWNPDDLAPRMLAATVASVIVELTHQPEPGNLELAMSFIRAAAATLPTR